MSEYGYRKRPDPKSILDPGAVALPRREWPRKIPLGLEATAGGAGAGLYEKQGIFMMGVDNDQHIFGTGTALALTSGGAGTLSRPGWWAAVNRGGFIANIVHTTGTITWHRYGVSVELSPQAWVDPDHPKIPAMFRMEDVVVARTIGSASGNQGGINFGLSWENSVPVNGLTPYPYIGWQSEWTHPDTYGIWSAYIVDEVGSVIATSSSGITTEFPHHLAVELDGYNKAVRFYIDNALFYTVFPSAGAVHAHTIYRTDMHYVVTAAGSAEVQAMWNLDHQSLCSIRAMDHVG